MEITRRFGRIGSVLLPVALLAVLFKYLHPLNSILHGVEGWGARKIAFTLFISFLSIWSLLHVGSILFIRIVNWVWSGTLPNLRENIDYSAHENQENSLRGRMDFHNAREEKALFKLDIQDESAA
jgi:hypothetical protein